MENNWKEKLTLSVDETSRLLNVSRHTVYEAVRRGEVPSVKLGRRILIPRAALQRLLEGTNTGAA